MLAEQLAHIVGDADDEQRHRHGRVRHVLDELGEFRLGVLGGDAVVLVDDENDVLLVDALEQRDQLGDADMAGRELVEIVDAGAARGADAVGQQGRRHAAQQTAENILEAELGIARQAQHEIAGILRLAGEDVGQRGLAAAALAIDDDMGALFLDGGDDALHLLVAAREEGGVVLRPGRRERIAQLGAEAGGIGHRRMRAFPRHARRGERESGVIGSIRAGCGTGLVARRRYGG